MESKSKPSYEGPFDLKLDLTGLSPQESARYIRFHESGKINSHDKGGINILKNYIWLQKRINLKALDHLLQRYVEENEPFELNEKDIVERCKNTQATKLFGRYRVLPFDENFFSDEKFFSNNTR